MKKNSNAIKMATGNQAFTLACERANKALENRPGYCKVLPTARQLRKFRRGEGSAYQFGRLLPL